MHRTFVRVNAIEPVYTSETIADYTYVEVDKSFVMVGANLLQQDLLDLVILTLDFASYTSQPLGLPTSSAGLLATEPCRPIVQFKCKS